MSSLAVELFKLLSIKLIRRVHWDPEVPEKKLGQKNCPVRHFCGRRNIKCFFVVFLLTESKQLELIIRTAYYGWSY